MKRKMLLILGAVLVLGAVLAAAAVAQNAENGKARRGTHECTPEMMEDPAKMAENCPAEAMGSGACEGMTEGSMKGCSSMMSGENSGHMDEPGHCGGMGTPAKPAGGSMM